MSVTEIKLDDHRQLELKVLLLDLSERTKVGFDLHGSVAAYLLVWDHNGEMHELTTESLTADAALAGVNLAAYRLCGRLEGEEDEDE